MLKRNPHCLFKSIRRCTHIHKRQFKTDRTVEKVQEAAPFFKDRCPVFLLCQLIIDILKLNCLRVIAVSHPADTVLKHPVKRNRLLCCPRNPVIFPRFFDHLSDLLLFPPVQICRYFYVFRLIFLLLSEQSLLPPCILRTAAGQRHNSCLSDTV